MVGASYNGIPECLLANLMDGTPQDVIERYAGLSLAAEQADFGEYDTNVVVIDTETTGVSFKHDELTQIAAARLVNGKPEEWFVTFVDPGMPIPDEIVHLTGICDEDVAGAPSPEEALADLVEFVGDAKLVAHNAYFDKHFVTAHPEGYPLLENEWIDSLELSRISLPRMKSHRLIDLVKAFDAPLSTHRADEDVVATCSLYRILLAAVDAMPEPLLQEIGTFATPELWPFGKVFKAFAERKRMALEEDQLTDEERAMGRVLLPGVFSLAECRKKRVKAIPKVKHPDAAEMFPPRLLEKLRESGATVKAANGGEPAALSFPSQTDMEDVFCAEGRMGRIYPDFETREEQLKMACAVCEAFEDSSNLMVEAGTGTGKSMAYLVPCVETALRNNITVGIATKTNALLDQLVYKELPALASATELTFVPLKGFTHYPCLLRINRILRNGPELRTYGGDQLSQAPALAALLSYIEQTDYDDIDALKIDYRALPRQAITTTSNDCLRRKCPFYGTECFVHGQRMRAESADVVVTNHSLLFYDAAANGTLLPPIRYWVVDEAHGAEEEARRALSLDVSMDALARIARRTSSEDPKTNVFLAAARKVDLPEPADMQAFEEGLDSAGSTSSGNGSGEGSFAGSSSFGVDEAAGSPSPSESNSDKLQYDPNEPGALFYGLIAKARRRAGDFATAQNEFSQQALTLHDFDTQKKSSYETFDLWINQGVRSSGQFKLLASYAKDMIEKAEKLVNTSQEIVAVMDDFKGVGFVQREIASVALELKEIVQSATSIFLNPSEAFVYSVTLNRREAKGAGKGVLGKSTRLSQGRTTFHAQLYNVGQALDETLYANTRSVVFTSATLTVNGSFAPFEEAMGLNTSEQSRAGGLILDPSFDFDSNMKVLVISDMPEPNDPKYMDALQEFMLDAHIAQGGSMLSLFTNRKELDKCFSVVEPGLKEKGIRLVCQRRGTSIKLLRDEFLANESLSMFALKSFWEGFDAPGATLRGVVIPKLPFAKPSDPLSMERKDRDDSAWRKFDLPRAVIDVRQAAGRLIRKADDTGTLVLCDSRLLSKGYGKVFINSLPSSNVSVVTAEEACDFLRRS